jgi:hypothetical protein
MTIDLDHRFAAGNSSLKKFYVAEWVRVPIPYSKGSEHIVTRSQGRRAAGLDSESWTRSGSRPAGHAFRIRAGQNARSSLTRSVHGQLGSTRLNFFTS